MTEFIIPTTLVLCGLLALGAGGELLVRGASRLAAVARITPLVIGLTVVAFGTSSPFPGSLCACRLDSCSWVWQC